MPLNKEKKNSRFEVVVEQFGPWDLTKKTLINDTITVPQGHLQMEVIPVGPKIDQTRLIINSNGEKDSGFRAKLDYVPMENDLLSNLMFDAKLFLVKTNELQTASNINFACPDITTELEAPLVAGRITAKIRRLT